jgi:hypothetical protein
MAKLLHVNGWEQSCRGSDSNVELNDTRSQPNIVSTRWCILLALLLYIILAVFGCKMLVLLLVVVFNTSKLTHKKLTSWMFGWRCYFAFELTFPNIWKRRWRERERGGVHQTNTNYHLLEVLVFWRFWLQSVSFGVSLLQNKGEEGIRSRAQEMRRGSQ